MRGEPAVICGECGILVTLSSKMKRKVRKAVFPAAGMGTRFLPATKAQPKETLPLVDKPLIQYGVEETLASGVDNIIVVTGRGKAAIEDHFDRNAELEHELEARGKTEELESGARDLGSGAHELHASRGTAGLGARRRGDQGAGRRRALRGGARRRCDQIRGSLPQAVAEHLRLLRRRRDRRDGGAARADLGLWGGGGDSGRVRRLQRPLVPRDRFGREASGRRRRPRTWP